MGSTSIRGYRFHQYEDFERIKQAVGGSVIRVEQIPGHGFHNRMNPELSEYMLDVVSHSGVAHSEAVGDSKKCFIPGEQTEDFTFPGCKIGMLRSRHRARMGGSGCYSR